VDVGVHQDGLVHVSQLADRYVSDPNAVVTVGQKVKVRVMSVDLERNRIALTMRRDSSTAGQRSQPSRGPRQSAPPPVPRIPQRGEIAPNGMRFK
jgi:uncharacterized protein